ncbi:unnamed protein product, partial [Adineta ricciae]
CLPDFLSRYANDIDDDLFEIDYGLENKQSILASMVLRSHTNRNRAPMTSDSLNDDSFPPVSSTSSIPPNAPSSTTFSPNTFDPSKLKVEQDSDPVIQAILSRIRHRFDVPTFVLKHDLLYKLIRPSRRSKHKLEVIYLPQSMTASLVQTCHDDPMTGAHFSFDRIYNKIRRLYWWPRMKATIKYYLDSCMSCKQFNISRHKKFGHLRPISPPDGPFLLIGIDYCGPLKSTPRENKYVLVITDYFTRHIVAVALPNCTAETTAQALFNEYFCRYGIPAVILSDQGSHFRNNSWLISNI